jgi:glutamate-1-semialdehyde 2,1-aminomutase
VLIPYIAPSLSHTDQDVELTLQAAHEALAVVRDALENGSIGALLEGPPVKPVFRRYNAVDMDA